MLVISDIHLYMYRRTKLLLPCNVAQDTSIDNVHNTVTLQYMDDCIKNTLKTNKNPIIVFLGDVIDNAYLKEPEIQEFKDVLKQYPHNRKIIILGNHDTSSNIPENKLKYSALRYLANVVNLEFITDYSIEIKDTKILIYWSFTQRKDMYEKLSLVFSKVKKITQDTTISEIILLTHNNIYLTDTLFNQRMYPLPTIVKMLDEAYIDKKIKFTVINGHIHKTHYEKCVNMY